MQGTRVRALVWEDPTCHGATKPVHHNYWACALEPASHNYWAHMLQLLKPVRLEPVLCTKRSHSNEKPTHCNEDPIQPKNELINLKKSDPQIGTQWGSERSMSVDLWTPLRIANENHYKPTLMDHWLHARLDAEHINSLPNVMFTTHLAEWRKLSLRWVKKFAQGQGGCEWKSRDGKTVILSQPCFTHCGGRSPSRSDGRWGISPQE